MANDLTSNITRKLARVFLDHMQASRVVTKTVDTQLLSGKFNPSSGSTVDFKRPHDYNTISTADGDISSSTKSDIISGKATGTVQNYLTQATEWNGLEEAIELDQLDQILAPMARKSITDLELNLVDFIRVRAGLSYGVPDEPVDAWSDVAGAGALMKAVGVPSDAPWTYVMNPFGELALADAQNGLTSADQLVRTAWEDAQISRNFGGMRAITSNALKSFTSSAASDRAGTLTATPTATYVSVKDTMQQTLAVTAFTASVDIKAGDIIEVTGRNRLNIATREVILGADGLPIKWRATVLADVTLGVSGEGSIVVSGPAIRETDGQYNTVDTALTSGDVVTILGTASTVYQPNLFYHPQAVGLGTVKLPKLFATDTIATTEDGFSIRVSKYSDGDANTQKVRFDLVPAFAMFDPFKVGLGYGVA